MRSNLIFTPLVIFILVVVVLVLLIFTFVHNADALNFNNEPKYLQINSITNGPEKSGVASNFNLPEETIINSLNKYEKNECEPCGIKVNDHMTDKSPLFTLQNERTYIPPDRSGEIVIPYGGWVKLRCSDEFVSPCGGQVLNAQCAGGQNFRINDEVVKYEDINCTSVSRPTVKRTGLSCCGHGELLAITNQFDDGEIHTMQACFDEINQKTYYVAHIVYPGTKHHKRNVPRKNFNKKGFFPGVDVNCCYKTQLQTFTKILGMDASIYVTNKNYLARGHLAAKADQIFSGQQMSTFHYINAAPQWQSFNGGNWSSIENGVREYANNNDTTLLCWTGILGICTLANVDGLQQELYLHIDKQNNRSIPVPKLFFRIVIDSESRKGIVLVGINNPYLTIAEVQSGGYVIAEDISDKTTLIKCDRKNIEKGYCYACTVPNFAAVVKDLPHNDLKTTGILGLKELAT